MQFVNVEQAEKLIEASRELQATLSLWMVEVARARRSNSAGGKILRFPGPLDERAKAAQDALEGFLVTSEKQ